MGSFGYKINNYEAGSVYEVMCGVRKKYDTKPAMLTNSLFLDFLKANGLTAKNENAGCNMFKLQLWKPNI